MVARFWATHGVQITFVSQKWRDRDRQLASEAERLPQLVAKAPAKKTGGTDFGTMGRLKPEVGHTWRPEGAGVLVFQAKCRCF